MSMSILAFIAAIGITDAGVKTAVTISGYPYPDSSGITWVDGKTFYVVRDGGGVTQNGCYLHKMTPALDDGGNLNSQPTMDTGVILQGAYDAEGVVRDPCTGNVWVADEHGATIMEYDPVTGWPTYRTVPVPAVITGHVRGNLSLESLTMSGDGLTLWTANEEALDGDGVTAAGGASSGIGTIVRLVKFVRDGVNAPWTLAGMWAYQCEPLYNDEPQNGGVSDLVSLPDGSLLVMERHVEATSWGIVRIYRPDFTGATDVRDIAALSGASYVKVSKGTPLYTKYDGGDAISGGFGDYDVACYEGLCLGPRNSDGSVNLMMISDGGAVKNVDALFFTVTVTTQPYVRALKLSGLDVRTVSFDKPMHGDSSIVGKNYRYLNGAQVPVSLTGAATDKPYAVDGEKLAVCNGWSMTGGSPSSGTGAAASFAVIGDGTFAWNVDQATANAGYHVSDSFEGFAPGTAVGDIDGWRGGDCAVEGADYQPPMPPGFVMQKETHTKVLNAEEDEAIRDISSAMQGTDRVDVMVCPRRAAAPLKPLSDDIQIQVTLDPQGRFCVWHSYEEGGVWKRGWIPLSETTYADGTWVRIGIELDYASNPGGDAFAKVTVNGSCQPTPHGVRSPTDTRAYGPWHHLARAHHTGGVAPPKEIGFTGAKVDDLMLCKRTIVPEHAGPTSVEGIEFSWFDAAGLPRDPKAAAPFIPGYTLGDVYAAGLDPYSDSPFEVTGFELDVNGRPHIEFNGYKGKDPVGFRILYSLTADFKVPAMLGTSDGTFVGDERSGSTTWVGNSKTRPGAGFYRVEAVK